MSATVVMAFKGFIECLLQYSLILKDLLSVCYSSFCYLSFCGLASIEVIAFKGFTGCLLQLTLLDCLLSVVNAF